MDSAMCNDSLSVISTILYSLIIKQLTIGSLMIIKVELFASQGAIEILASRTIDGSPIIVGQEHLMEGMLETQDQRPQMRYRILIVVDMVVSQLSVGVVDHFVH